MSEDGEATGDVRLVQCDRHGGDTAAFVCRHLVEGSPVPSSGFNWWIDETDPVALCDACSAEVDDVTPWPDEFVDDKMRLVCRSCFLDIAEAHGVSRVAIEKAEAVERGDTH